MEFVAQTVVVVVVPLLLGFLFPAHARPVALAGALLGFGFWSFLLLSALLLDPDSSSSSGGEWSLGNYVFFYGVWVAASLLVWLLFAWVGLRVITNEHR